MTDREINERGWDRVWQAAGVMAALTFSVLAGALATYACGTAVGLFVAVGVAYGVGRDNA